MREKTYIVLPDIIGRPLIDLELVDADLNCLAVGVGAGALWKLRRKLILRDIVIRKNLGRRLANAIVFGLHNGKEWKVIMR